MVSKLAAELGTGGGSSLGFWCSRGRGAYLVVCCLTLQEGVLTVVVELKAVVEMCLGLLAQADMADMVLVWRRHWPGVSWCFWSWCCCACLCDW